jgi:DNA topoisomerase VI subunit B
VRPVFVTSRAAEFLQVGTLTALTGQSRDRFGDVVVKELLDNAADATESAGVVPCIAVSTVEDDDTLRVTVTDNGSGMPPEVVERILNFEATASSNAAYRSPTRGLQGNAWKTIIGIAHVGAGEPVVIEACGVRHEITVAVDPGGHVRVHHRREQSDRTTGTAVTVALPIMWDVDVKAWLQSFAMINPHAELGLLANPDDGETPVSYKPTVSDGWRKPLPTDKLRPHWYDLDAMQRLVFAHIDEHRRGGRDLPIGHFIRSFEGLSDTRKAKQIWGRVPQITHLSGFDADRDAIGDLLAAMKGVAKEPKSKDLGSVPEDHYQARLDELFGVQRFWFKRGSVTVDGIPWVIEVAVAETVHPGRVIFAMNYSASFGDPLGGTWLEVGDESCHGSESALRECDAAPSYLGSRNRAAVVHVVTPAAQFLDKGKVRLIVPPEVAEECSRTIAAAGRTLLRERKQYEKDAAAAERRRDRERRQEEREREAEARGERAEKVSIKDAVFVVMAESVEHVSGNGALPIPQRNLFYAVRDRIQQFNTGALKQPWFRTCLTEYQQKHGEITGLYFKPRGELREPHTDKVVPLGTREVSEYRFPEYLFDKILYVEKEGFAPLFEAAKLGERYDMAIAGGMGQPVEAVRALFERAERGEIRLFVLHDADPDGYSIRRTIADETDRMPDYSVEVIDLGLTVGDAIDRGLSPEGFTRQKALPGNVEFTDLELEWFTGTPSAHKTVNGERVPKEWVAQRVELNAFSAPGLIAYIEEGLARHGATGKVIPPQERIDRQAAGDLEQQLIEMVDEEIVKRLHPARIARQLIEERGDELVGVDLAAVEAKLNERTEMSWRGAVDEIVGGKIGYHNADGEITARIGELIGNAWTDDGSAA